MGVFFWCVFCSIWSTSRWESVSTAPSTVVKSRWVQMGLRDPYFPCIMAGHWRQCSYCLPITVFLSFLRLLSRGVISLCQMHCSFLFYFSFINLLFCLFSFSFFKNFCFTSHCIQKKKSFLEDIKQIINRDADKIMRDFISEVLALAGQILVP